MAKKTVDDEVKPANDAYTGMLVISLLALLTGSVLLFLDWNQYPEKAPSKVEKFIPKTAPAAPPAGQPVPPAGNPPAGNPPGGNPFGGNPQPANPNP